MTMWMFLQICMNLTYPLGTLIFYESDWGLLLATFSLVASLQANINKAWQHTAVILTEASIAFNIVITIVVFTFLLPYMMLHPQPQPPKPDPSNQEGLSPWMWYQVWQMIFEHLMPLVLTALNIYLSDIYLLKEDYKMIFGLGIVYMFCNGLGEYEYQLPGGLYPTMFLDWSNPVLTFCTYTFQAVVLSFIFYKVAQYTENHKPARK